MAKTEITIVIDEETGDAEIRSPSHMTNDEVLDILNMAVDATCDSLEKLERELARDAMDPDSDPIAATLAALPKKFYLN